MARLAGPGITFFVALGFQLSGFENFYVALALWGFAGLWALGAFLTWRPISERVRFRRKQAQLAKPHGVVTDIQHRGGCPKNPARQETWTRTREHDGMEITVGKCNDCGAMAYRHGDRARASVSTTGTSDPELHALLSHGRGIKDDYLLGGGLPSINKAQRDESHRWTRDTASVLKARDPALAEGFLAQQSHRGRLTFLEQVLGDES